MELTGREDSNWLGFNYVKNVFMPFMLATFTRRMHSHKQTFHRSHNLHKENKINVRIQSVKRYKYIEKVTDGSPTSVR